MDNDTLYFSEAQPFRMWWVWLIVLGISFFFVGAFVRQVLLGYPVGSNPSSDGVLIVGALLSLVLVALFWFMRLETHIGSEGIYTRFFSFIPFKKRSWGSIQELRIRRYSPIGALAVTVPLTCRAISDCKSGRYRAIGCSSVPSNLRPWMRLFGRYRFCRGSIYL